MTIWRMRIACWLPKATNTHTHTDCVILITFPLPQWLQERAAVLRCTYIASLIGYVNYPFSIPKPVYLNISK